MIIVLDEARNDDHEERWGECRDVWRAVHDAGPNPYSDTHIEAGDFDHDTTIVMVVDGDW